MPEDLNTKTVTVRDATMATRVEHNLVEGAYEVKLDQDESILPRLSSWLPASAARKLAADLVDQAYEADKRNGTEPQLDAVEFHAAAASVEQFLSDQLQRDDMSLAEIAANVTAIARGQG